MKLKHMRSPTLSGPHPFPETYTLKAVCCSRLTNNVSQQLGPKHLQWKRKCLNNTSAGAILLPDTFAVSLWAFLVASETCRFLDYLLMVRKNISIFKIAV
jgi:hypothetical protein